MPDISKITLPSGTSYDIKDATAREAIANLQNIENILSTNAATTPEGVVWNDNGTTITGTLVASSETIKKIYLVLNESSTDQKNTYKEYLTLKVGNTYKWEMIGTTEASLSNLGNLAYKDSASTTYTPAGSVSAPTVTLSKTNIQTIDSVGTLPTCTLPTFTATVANENLTLAWANGSFNAGTLPTKNSQISVATDVDTVSTPEFTGTQVSIIVS